MVGKACVLVTEQHLKETEKGLRMKRSWSKQVSFIKGKGIFAGVNTTVWFRRKVVAHPAGVCSSLCLGTLQLHGPIRCSSLHENSSSAG